MSNVSLSDTLRALASKLDGVQDILRNGGPAQGWSPYPGLNTTVPISVPLGSSAVLQKLDSLAQEVSQLKQAVASLSKQGTAPSILPLHPMHGIEIVPKREVVVPEAASLSVADRLLLNRNAKKALEAEEMGASRVDEYPLGEEDDEDAVMQKEGQWQVSGSSMEVEEEQAEEEQAEEEAEEEAEEVEEAEEEAEAEEDVEEEAEEQGVELEEFEY